MLAIQHLHIEFGARVIFSDLSFAVLPKERIAFAGHNGAGKSTLMKCIAGIRASTSKAFHFGTRLKPPSRRLVIYSAK